MKSPLMPSLWSMGFHLDTTPDAFGYLDSAKDWMDDPVALRDRMADDGYIYLPGFWPRESVQKTRMSLLRRLHRLGFLDRSKPIEEGVPNQAKDDGPLSRARNNPLPQDDPRVMDLLYGKRISDFFEQFLGGPAAHFDYTWYRTKTPGLGTPLHCDIVYMGRGTSNLFTAWIPFGDIPLQMGGVIILEKSHKHAGQLDKYLSRDVDTYCLNEPEAEQFASGQNWWDGTLSRNPPLLRERLGGRWLTAPFKMGDILIFEMKLVHGSLDNRTGLLRLSADCRYQLASEPIDERWVGETPVGHGTELKRGLIC